jgi:hypothetical protein
LTPKPVVEVELVAERAVGADLFAADAGGELRNEVPVGFFAGGGEQRLKRTAGGAFVGDFVRGVAGEFFVVALDFLVRGFELVRKRRDLFRSELRGIRSGSQAANPSLAPP